jgi:hypothetical protein
MKRDYQTPKRGILTKGFVNFLDKRAISDCYLKLHGKFNMIDISNCLFKFFTQKFKRENLF